MLEENLQIETYKNLKKIVGKKRKSGEALCHADNQMGLILDQAISDPGIRKFAHEKNVNMKQ